MDDDPLVRLRSSAEQRREGISNYVSPLTILVSACIIFDRLGLLVARTRLGVPRKTRRAYFAKAVPQGVRNLKRVEWQSLLSMRRRGHDEARISRIDKSRMDRDEINHGETPTHTSAVFP